MIDETCRFSLDGPRVNKYILQQIRPADLPIFRKCLQIIKYWAMQRDIYNKQCGYLNGGTWTLLLLKSYLIEQSKSVTFSITHLLYSFFDTWSNWPWQTPVMFHDYIPGKEGQRHSYNSLTEFHEAVMPIVSPCHPVNSAAPYVTKSTLKIITRELQRGK